jgi:hypothetical protein
MQPVYFAHGYREREAPYTAFFGGLLDDLGLMPSVDPPSSDVNAAKLERHLNATSGLVAVISDRDGRASDYILYELWMAVRAGKPAIAFIEDTPSGPRPAW